MSESTPSVAARRAQFNTSAAPSLASATGPVGAWAGSASRRFSYFVDDDVFVVVAGEQEGSDVDLALAYGLGLRGERRLRLVLPRTYAFPTAQRASCLTAAARPELFVHDGESIEPLAVPSIDQAVAQFAEVLGGMTPEQELKRASTPAHLGDDASGVEELSEWAARHPQLDSGHRRGERSWHCAGLRVLSIKRTRDGSSITAGVHFTKADEAPAPRHVPKGALLSSDVVAAIITDVEHGVRARLDAEGRLHRADEHWLQSVIRARPALTGVEHPALRELPAWRPTGGPKRWGRGFVDLVGVDAHGDIRIVETKLAKNRDDLMVVQGVDYYLWARAYGSALRSRLGVSDRADIVVHYVIGSDIDGKIHLSHHAPLQAAALAIPWRCQHVRDWFQLPADIDKATSSILPRGVMQA